MSMKLFLMMSISSSIGILMANWAPQTTSSRQPRARPPGAVMSSGVSGQAAARATPTTPEGELFERARGSVFVVETESGHGSGFLVDAGGLIVTNDHIVRNTEYLAVAVEPRRKYPAVVVARDRLRDIAIVQIHPRAVVGRLPLKFVEPTTAVRVGERVLAIGSALTNDASLLTAGMVSRVAPDTFVADLNVNPGSSGGPVLNLNGDVIGISTYVVRAAAGPGFAGIVRAEAARPVLATAKASLNDELPPLEELPVPSAVPYPQDALNQRVAAPHNKAGYAAKLGRLRIDVLTPPIVYYEAHIARIREAAREQRQNAEAHGNGTGYIWHAHAAQLEAIVGIRVMADFGDSAKTTVDSAGDVGAPMPPHTRAARTGVQSDFGRMRLFRDGVEVIPIVPGRFCAPPLQPGTDEQPARCFGLYQYLPEAFAPGARLELHVYSADPRTRRQVWTLPSKLVAIVWSDFEPWRTAVAAALRRP